jgi:hypothetical protein
MILEEIGGATKAKLALGRLAVPLSSISSRFGPLPSLTLASLRLLHAGEGAGPQ